MGVEQDLIKIATHKAEVSSMVWAGVGNEACLFSGDELGAIFKTNFGSRKNFFAVLTPEFLYQCDSYVEQTDKQTKKPLCLKLRIKPILFVVALQESDSSFLRC